MLHWTSCLFATVVVHAFYAQDVMYHHIFLALTTTSLLCHTGHATVWVKAIDVLLSHTAVIVATYRAPSWVAEVFPATVACLWVAQRRVSSEEADRLHAILHLVAVVGMHVFIATAR